MRILPTYTLALLTTAAFAQTNYDARIEAYTGLEHACAGSAGPAARIKNVGTTTMSTCVVETWKNGVMDNSFNWILGVPAATGESRTPSFPPVPAAPGDVIELRIISVNGNADEDANGNILSKTLVAEPAPGSSYGVNVEVKTDDNPDETTWMIRNELGAVVVQGGPYTEPNGMQQATLVLSPSDCYTFELMDSGGDGMSAGSRSPGYARVSSLGATLVEIDGADLTSQAREGLKTGIDACALTQLTASDAPETSCGADIWLSGGSTLHATQVPGANRYQWLFTRGTYARAIAKPTNALPITKWATNPLKPGRYYDVQVRASFDNGATWCPYGPVCSVRTRNGVQAMVRSVEAEDAQADASLTLFPVPNDGAGVNITVDAVIDEQGTARLLVFDLSGRLVYDGILNLSEGEQTLDVRFGQPISDGVYAVQLHTPLGTRNARMVVR
ncbi:MAG: T9SS type A sorting domain-containing protein [Flavobacteriales bacterium]|nr:MAG: T9SS type A sorting domain-containing protein [Flavobacteriales bacterium]